MAQMYPSKIIEYNPTFSERVLYDLFRDNLSELFHVFYSVSWYYLDYKNNRCHSECDFLILHEKYGYICLEVKGGKNITLENNIWSLENFDGSIRTLKESPFAQAEKSAYYLKEYFEREMNINYNAVHGFAVAFPNFIIEDSITAGAPKEIILDKESFSNIEERLIKIMNYWRNNQIMHIFPKTIVERLIRVVNKRIAMSAAAGALIDIKKKEIEHLNRIQMNLIHLLSNYQRAYIVGGAGTGKTWLAITKAKIEKSNGKRVLIICTSINLKKYIENQLNDDEILIMDRESLSALYNNYESSKISPFDVILVDEAQDFIEDEAIMINLLLNPTDNSILYVFFDNDQNTKTYNFKDFFGIKYPMFVLKENIRNTKNIIEYTTKQTSKGSNSIPNNIEGADPIFEKFKDKRLLLLRFEKLIHSLIDNEFVPSKNITVLSNRSLQESVLPDSFGNKKLVENQPSKNRNEIAYYQVNEFKGLESDVIIYLNESAKLFNQEHLDRLRYIAHTRARFFLFELYLEEV